MSTDKNPEILNEWLALSPLIERAQKLNRISYSLTICARDVATSATLGQATIVHKLLGISELHHKLSAQIAHYHAGEEIKVYPVDVFCRILYNVAAKHEIVSLLVGAVNFAMTGKWSIG
jgi:hypothetical protein